MFRHPRKTGDGGTVGIIAMRRIALLAALILAATAAVAAQPPSPVGTWKSIDDETGKPRALIELFQKGGEVQGRIVKGFPEPGEKTPKTCDRCPGDFKGKPVLGLVFMWGFKPEDDSWRGGEILDPDSGIVYDARLRLSDDAQRLE